MSKTIIHISDLHFRENWDEDLGILLHGFFEDVNKQIKSLIFKFL